MAEPRDCEIRFNVTKTLAQRIDALAPDPRYPSFSSTPLGVDPDTGKAWGAKG